MSLGKREGQFRQQTVPQRQPERGRVHLVLRQFELSRADVLVSEELDLLEAHNLRAHQHLTVHPRCRTRNALLLRNFKYSHLGVPDGIGVVVHVHRFHVSFALVEIQPLDVILLPLMDVDRFRMNGGERGREVDLPDHLGPAVLFARRVDNHKIVRGHRS